MSLNGPNNFVPYVATAFEDSIAKAVNTDTDVVSIDGLLKVRVPSALNKSMQVSLSSGVLPVSCNTYSPSSSGDYLFAKLNANVANTPNNTDIPFVAMASSNIATAASGVFTLKAGKIYELDSFLFVDDPANGSASYLDYRWVNSTTNTILSNTTAGWVSSTNANGGAFQASIVAAKGIFTPTADTDVKVRTGSVGSQISGSNFDSNYSYASIKQIGIVGLPAMKIVSLSTTPIHLSFTCNFPTGVPGFVQRADLVAQDNTVAYRLTLHTTGVAATPYLIEIKKLNLS